MSAKEEAIEHQAAGSTKLFLWVWFGLLILTGVETLMAYEDWALLIMLTILMGLSLVKSAYILSYFMHLRFEKLGLFLMTIPVFVFLICMMLLVLYPDSVRLIHMRAL
ncbi:MAG TPA: cytochrome C oxidase subunit IV family protein [Candidatus Dormibacteraeota bacterium]|nr:cytochrome C oxidase subunit IV family protein [Candidatus Dormibacteraeota bacterium]